MLKIQRYLVSSIIHFLSSFLFFFLLNIDGVIRNDITAVFLNVCQYSPLLSTYYSHHIICEVMYTIWISSGSRHQHPIVTVIKEHRTLAKLFNCTLGSICSLARLSLRNQRYTLHGHWLQTSTATGRLSVEEPNLQVYVFFAVFSCKMNSLTNLYVITFFFLGLI